MGSLEVAAAKLIKFVMDKHGLQSVDELQCPHMRELAEALRPAYDAETVSRGIGVHSNSDMFRGL